MAISIDNIYDPNVHKYVEDYTFKDVQKLSDKAWAITLSGYELAKLWDEQKIIYYPATQRGVELKKQRNGEYKLKAVFNKKSVSEIQRLIIKEDYFPDLLTINLLDFKDEIDRIIYDDSDRTLVIIKGLLCMLDGQHRTKACHNIYQDMIKLGGEEAKLRERILKNLIFQIKITNYDEETAVKYFLQLSKGEKMSKSRQELFNKQSAVTRIIESLNKRGALEGKIDTVKTTIGKTNIKHITTFNTLTTAFRNTFSDITDEEMEKEISLFLQEFFSELFKIYPELNNYESRQLSKEVDLTCENFMFYGYMGLAHQLYLFRGHNWKEMMWRIEGIDMNKTNPAWRKIMREGKDGLVIINNNSTRRTLKDVYLEQFARQQAKRD